MYYIINSNNSRDRKITIKNLKDLIVDKDLIKKEEIKIIREKKLFNK
jgi:hypothetical protein